MLQHTLLHPSLLPFLLQRSKWQRTFEEDARIEMAGDSGEYSALTAHDRYRIQEGDKTEDTSM